MNAPVIFFAYNRPELAKATLESLKANELSADSELYIYADGPKPDCSAEGLKNITETRKVLRSEQWCGKVTITESETNKGLAASVLAGVSEVLKKYDNAIIVEDDVLLSGFFLQYMNDALNMYKNDSQVFAIAGWTYFTRLGKIKETFFMRYPDSISWGVFKRSWDQFNYDAIDLKSKLHQTGNMSRFNPFSKYHYFDKMLDMQIDSKIDSWAIRWTATTVLNNGLVLYPPVSMSKHMGDKTGTHEVLDYNADLKLASDRVILKRQPIQENKIAFEEWKHFIKINFLQEKLSIRIKKSIGSLIPDGIKKTVRKILKNNLQ
jgi:Glycosyl transferase family 2